MNLDAFVHVQHSALITSIVHIFMEWNAMEDRNETVSFRYVNFQL